MIEEKIPMPVPGTPKQSPYAFVFGGVLLFVVGVVTGLNLQNKTQPKMIVDTGQNATPSPQDHRLTTLAVDSSAATVSTNSVSVPITIETAGNTVSAVELQVAVDPSTVTGLTVSPGTFFTNPTVLESNAGATPGTYIFTIGSLTPKQGVGIVALVSWTKTAGTTGSVIVRLAPQTQVSAIGEAGTVLKASTEGVVRY